MKKERLLFSIFFMVLLTFVNASPLHVFSHQQNADDDCIENCTICDVAFEIQLDDYLPCHIQNLKFTSSLVINEPQKDYQEVIVIANTDNNLFCRPPPTLI